MMSKLLIKVTFLCLFLVTTVASHANLDDNLPDIGTTAGNTLTINQEMIIGDYYLRQLRGGAPLIYDPILIDYTNKLGNRLVKQADSVKTPFSFHLINNDDINAFAFFGGNVVLHSALFKETDNESQLASVVAHEIAHVTQRHLARAMEEQKKNAPVIWASALGSILLAMANPEAGMAALTTTIAGSQQSVISFTQANEQEADRLSLRMLHRANFSVQGMPEFMEKLSDKYRYASKPPEMLLTHPLPDSRVADTRNRANQFKAKTSPSSLDYWLAKVRISTMYSRTTNPQFKQVLFEQLEKGNNNEKIAAQYGRAIDAYKAQNHVVAQQLLQPLLTAQPNNVWFIDLMTDIDLSQQRYSHAINRLESALKKNPKSTVMQLNLANAYIESKQGAKALTLLNRYTFNNANDINGWELLAKAASMQNIPDEEYAARAEFFALTGRIDQALSMLDSASKIVKTGSLKQARYDARIDQLRKLQQRFDQFVRK